MKEFYTKYKNIILIIVIAIVVFFLYSAFFGGDESSDSLLTGTSSIEDEQSAAIGREFLNILLELRSLDLDDSLFNDRSFIILRDFSQEVELQPSGRPNPFSEIGNDPVLPVETPPIETSPADSDEEGEI